MGMLSGGFSAMGSYMTGSRPSQTAMDYFNNQYQNIAATVSTAGNAALQSVYQAAASSFNNLIQSRPWELAEAVIRQTAHIFDPNVINALSTLAEFQTAKPVMRRWVMTNPTIRTMYHNQKVEGYDGEYEDAQPGLVGEAHYDYRRATNSMVMLNDTGWSATTWREQLVADDAELSFFNKADIFKTWDSLLGLVETQEYDPTSIYNSRL
ncbi:hypothetical protein [Proteus mirabilis]|uniref:hypothetical protein n=1 Tax=Proteus mirabilis TaxID=584 RepID=UPI0034D76462